MPLKNLNHYLVLANDLEETKEFYVDVLGLTVGERPPFEFPGYWLYLDGRAVVHLADGQARDTLNESRESSANPSAQAPRDTGRLDHIAFEASGLADMITRLQGLAIPWDRREVPGQGLQQLFIRDPDGLKIELNYSAEEAEA